MTRRSAIEAFRSRYGRSPALVVRSPGRVNLIGDHTDYNDGFVLPMAIEQAVWIAAEPRTDKRLELESLLTKAEISADLDDLTKTATWADYVTGVASEFVSAGLPLSGWNGVVASDLPAGAGLSSSAALELASARVFAEMANVPWEPVSMAQLAQRAENTWVGANVGIMDQLISACGQADTALLIDCRSLDGSAVAVPPDVAVVVIDSGTRRGLVDSEYNERRSTCEEVARLGGVTALRDLDMDGLDSIRSELTELQFRRARHVINENAVTVKVAELLPAGDFDEVGRLMDESHASLRDDFEISTPAMDELVSRARSADGVHGARMTGGGFGGSAVALVDREAAERFAIEIPQVFRERTGNDAHGFVAKASAGTSARWQ
ncbi:MAG: galactokinase [Acidimicrobiia bacterium]|nr:galactokinase [Acidimicrobiia bacterium]